MRILYSFPHKIGAGQICTTAWHQASGLVNAGVKVDLHTGAVRREVPGVEHHKLTLGFGGLRIPYRLLGRRKACALHDFRVARFLENNAPNYSGVHAWPLGARRTIKVANKLGIPVFLERPNAHTRFAFETVAKECARLGFVLPKGHEHSYSSRSLAIEEQEYRDTTFLLCPSKFVEDTFLNYGFKKDKLVRHRYGYDPSRFRVPEKRAGQGPFRVIYAGGCAPRKGLHFAIDAWVQSGLLDKGEFLVCGGFVPGYRELIGSRLEHPSVKVLGHRADLNQLMADSDVLVLPSIEEGSALVTYEARGSGCVLCVSEAAGAVVDHGRTGLIHPVGDVATLSEYLARLCSDRILLNNLRSNSIAELPQLTWEAAGRHLAELFRQFGRGRDN